MQQTLRALPEGTARRCLHCFRDAGSGAGRRPSSRQGGLSPPPAPRGPAPRTWSPCARGAPGPPTGHSRSPPSACGPGSPYPSPQHSLSLTCLRKHRSPGRTRSVWKGDGARGLLVTGEAQARPPLGTPPSTLTRGTPRCPAPQRHPCVEKPQRWAFDTISPSSQANTLRRPGPPRVEEACLPAWGLGSQTSTAFAPHLLPTYKETPCGGARESPGPGVPSRLPGGAGPCPPRPCSREQVLVVDGGRGGQPAERGG